MRRKTWQGWLAVGLWVGLAAGCERAALRPSDPLLANRKPIEGKPEQTAPTLVARSEPDAPEPPALALASAPVDLGAAGKTRLASRTSVPVTPAVRSPVSSNVQATPAVRRRVSGTYGHAADYSWLQGVVERTPQGLLVLRFAAPEEREALGGRVWLEDDRRLARFREGDVLYVEGEIIRESGSALSQTGGLPRYRLRDVRPVPPGS